MIRLFLYSCFTTLLLLPALSQADCNNCSCDNATQPCICVDPAMESGDDSADFGRWSFNTAPPLSSGSTFTIPSSGAPTSSSLELDLDESDASAQLEICLKAADNGSSMNKTYYLIGTNLNDNFTDISATPNGLTIAANMVFDNGNTIESDHKTYTGTPISWIIRGSTTFSSSDLDTIAGNLPSDFELPMTIELREEAP